MAVEILDPEPPGAGDRTFEPNSWAQERFLISETPDLLYSGHLGSSKTRSLCEKADMRCWSFPNARVALGRRYRNHLGKSVITELREKVIKDGHWAWGWRPASDGGSTLHYPNGSELWMVGFDNPQRLLSAEVDMVLVEQCEELTEEMWDAAAGRLRKKTTRELPDGMIETAPFQIAGACNPDSPAHFLYRRFRPQIGSHIEYSHDDEKLPNGVVVPRGTPMAEVLIAGVLDNMENLPAAYIARLQRYKGRYYERMVLGKWIMFEGMIYDCFDAGLHVRKRPKSWLDWGGYPPPGWDRVRSFDFGFYPDPFVCQHWARSPAGSWWLYREIYHTRKIAAEHARRIAAEEQLELATLNSILERNGAAPIKYLPIIGSYGDHDSQVRHTIEQETGGEIIVQRAHKDIESGIQACYELLAPVEGQDKVKRSRLYFVDDALLEVDQDRADHGLPVRTVDEFGAYRYHKQDPTKPTREGPMDLHNHGMDAMRYAFATLKKHGY
jgi:phage terminase large subunit